MQSLSMTFPILHEATTGTRHRYPWIPLLFGIAIAMLALIISGHMNRAQATSGEVAGIVSDEAGKPIAQAWVTDGDAYTFTDNAGAFVFERGIISPNAMLTITGSGYRQVNVTIPADNSALITQLEMREIKGIYYNPRVMTTDADVDALIHLIDTTELNTVVIDIKEGVVLYDTDIRFFHDAGAVMPILDLPATLRKFHDHGIYTIARLAVFKGNEVANAVPSLGVRDNQTGALWRDMNGVAWLNPMLRATWDDNIALAQEAGSLGFDEIQYDYVRFPTDGEMTRVDYGFPDTQANRQYVIEDFLEVSRKALIPTGTRLSADIFGYTVVVDDDLGIGQNVDRLAPHVDYLSPMLYPSHWPDGTVPVPGHPNDFPYETIDYSMTLAIEQLDGNRLKFRPWLQDFDLPGMQHYDTADVRAQIDAAEQLGLAGWLIWSPTNVYHEDAFHADTNHPQSGAGIPVATPQASSAEYRTNTQRRRL